MPSPGILAFPLPALALARALFGSARLALLLEVALTQLVLFLGRKLAQSLVCLARRLALPGRHRRPVADALLVALLLDRLHRRIAARGGNEPLLLVAGHAFPIRGDRAEDAPLLRGQSCPRGLRRVRVGAGGDGQGRYPGENRREGQDCGLPSHARKSWSRKASRGRSRVTNCRRPPSSS